MKIKDTLKELRNKDNKNLFKDLENSRRHLIKLKFENTFRKLKNYSQIKQERKKIARLWTILSEKITANHNKGQ